MWAKWLMQLGEKAGISVPRRRTHDKGSPGFNEIPGTLIYGRKIYILGAASFHIMIDGALPGHPPLRLKGYLATFV